MEACDISCILRRQEVGFNMRCVIWQWKSIKMVSEKVLKWPCRMQDISHSMWFEWWFHSAFSLLESLCKSHLVWYILHFLLACFPSMRITFLFLKMVTISVQTNILPREVVDILHSPATKIDSNSIQTNPIQTALWSLCNIHTYGYPCICLYMCKHTSVYSV